MRQPLCQNQQRTLKTMLFSSKITYRIFYFWSNLFFYFYSFYNKNWREANTFPEEISLHQGMDCLRDFFTFTDFTQFRRFVCCVCGEFFLSQVSKFKDFCYAIEFLAKHKHILLQSNLHDVPTCSGALRRHSRSIFLFFLSIVIEIIDAILKALL